MSAITSIASTLAGAAVPAASSMLVDAAKARDDRRARDQAAAQDRQRREEEALREDERRRREGEALARAQDLESRQLRDRQEEEVRALEADAGGRLDQQRTEAEAGERRRRDALRRAMARTRAGLGGRGVGTADGSGEAILLGLVNDAGQERREVARTDALRRRAVQQELDDRRRRNLLEQAQLAERQRLELLARQS